MSSAAESVPRAGPVAPGDGRCAGRDIDPRSFVTRGQLLVGRPKEDAKEDRAWRNGPRELRRDEAYRPGAEQIG